MPDALDQIVRILRSIDEPPSHIPSTLLYNEGWLLRLALDMGSRDLRCSPFASEPGATWASEALLGSPFLPLFRRDPLAESFTHADGIVGHFQFAPNCKSAVSLLPAATQFVVLEAKIFSALSPGTKNAPGYDQAARTVACIARTVELRAAPVAAYQSLGFYVIAPQVQIASGLFRAEMSRDGIRAKVRQRVAMYADTTPDHLHGWLEEWFEPVLRQIAIDCISWESIMQQAVAANKDAGGELQRFYEQCLRERKVCGGERLSQNP